MTRTPETPTEARGRTGIGLVEAAVLAAVTLLPQLLGGRARVNADTKQYLYLDPTDLLQRSLSVWDQRVGGGAVTHQGVGYLWPMGPFYAAADALGLPDWAAQRLWVGGLQLVAALGALALFRHLLPRRRAQVVAAAAYGLSPFVLGHVTGQSGLLVPFAGLPWLVLLMAEAVESPRSWRWPAAFALVVTTCGSLNGSSVFFVLLGPVLWVPFALAGRGGTARRDGLRVLVRAGGLTLLTQLWWLAAYAVGGAYNLPVLDITENVRTTNATTSAPEVLRGLGYWFFYGRDTEGPWLADLSAPYLTSARLVAITFAIPILALLAAGALRWRHRAYFAALVGLGTLIAVGAFPIADPSPAGQAFETLSRSSPLVLSLRNTQRAGALIALGLAGLLAGGLSLLERRHAKAGLVSAAALAVFVALTLPAQWRTGLIAERFHRDEELPSWWEEAGQVLERGDGRVLELPGIDFASYRWGHTLDPVSVGLTDRPVMARELVPFGGAAGVDLLEALDRSMQEGWFEPESVAPVARLLGASSVLVRNDLEYERYRTVRPQVLWPMLSEDAAALGPPRTFEDGYRNQAGPARPMVDEVELGLDPTADDPPALALFEVPGGGRPRLSAFPVSRSVVVDGDGEGIVAAAAAQLLGDDTDDRVLLLGADVVLADETGDLADHGARLILTDSNRKRAKRWYSLRENAGATEPADAGVVLDDPSDARLQPVGADVPGTQTVVEWRGASRIWADHYGTPLTLLPEERPSNAFDGDPLTAWRASPNDDATRRVIGIELEDPVAADHVRLRAPIGRPGTTLPTRIELALDGDRRTTVDLDPAALLRPDGLDVALDGRPFERLEITVLDTEDPTKMTGFAEIEIPGVSVEEVTHLPTALVDGVGASLADLPVSIVLTRLRANPAEPVRADPERSMLRSIELPAALSTTLTGTARVDPSAPDAVIDALLGAGPEEWGVVVTTSEHLAGDVDSRGSAAFDDDLTTAWQTPLVGVTGQSISIARDEPLTVDSLDLDLVTDGRHSVPTALRVQAGDGAPVTVALPEVPATTDAGTSHVSVALPEPVRGERLTVTIATIDPVTTTDWYSGDPVTLPAGIAELDLPGVPVRPTAAIDTGCRSDLLEVGGRAVPVRIQGSADDATARVGLRLDGCTPLVELAAGTTELRTVPGRDTGLAIDRLVLDSPGTSLPPFGGPDPAPDVEVDEVSNGHAAGTVTTDGEPFWLVLDQSMNDGWELHVEGAAVEGPRPLDSYAAGWLVTPDAPGTLEVTADWAPQRLVRGALWASALAVVACLGLLLRRPDPAAWSPRSEPGLARHPSPPTWWTVAVATGLAALVVSLPAAVAAGAIVALARRWPLIGRWAPLALVGSAAAGVTVMQANHDHQPTFDWPTRFGWTHGAALLGVVLLLVLALRPASDERR